MNLKPRGVTYVSHLLQEGWMDKRINKDIFGRLVVGAIISYFIFKYNYEVSQLIHYGADWFASIRDSISTYLERTVDDSGILVGILLLIVYLLWALIQIILIIIVGIVVWVLVFLNDAYILPFLIPLLIVYSKFSYAFIVTPILWLPKKVFLLLGRFGRFLLRMCNLFIVLPIAEVISLKGSRGRKLYKIFTSLLFVFGLCGIIIGGTGLTVKIIQNGEVVSNIESFFKDKTSAVFAKSSYTDIQYQTVLHASTPNWTQTTIQLRKGDVVSFTATGLIRCISPFKAGMSTTSPTGIKDAISSSGHVTPNGLTKPYRRQGFSPSYYILPAEPINCLMAKVGMGQPFAVGSSKTYKVNQDGLLFIGINQRWKSGEWRNNSGQLNISIIIRRKV